MSMVMPSPDASTSDASPAAHPPTAQSAKPQRVLACVLCQRRKVKCDRKFPCGNCIKSRVRCIPATLTPRRRRRRIPEQELLDRIRKYEDLLQQNNIKFDPLHKTSIGEHESPQGDDGDDSDDEHPSVGRVGRSPSSGDTKSDRRYEAKSFWHVMNKGFREPGEDSDSSQDDVRETVVNEAWDKVFQNSEYLLFGTGGTSVDLSTLHPDPVQIFKLWQIYLENVNPLLKVTHTPSLQARIIDAASNVGSISPNLEALMFSIYCMAVLSLVTDCETVLGEPREELLIKYQFGCQQALLNAGFLRTCNRDCLTALYLYLISVRSGTDPRALSAMLGIALRVAQRMGIHLETSNAKCTVLEAEMRRRLWWSFLHFDSRIGEMADNKASTLAPTWDCRIPLNVNDSDLRPEMTKEPPVIQGKCTDALFAVVRGELGEFVRHTPSHLDFTIPALKAVARAAQDDSIPEGGELEALENMIESKYLKFCDPENPLHYMTIWGARAYLAKCRLIEHYSKNSDMAGQTDAHRDAVNAIALEMIESDTKIMTSPLTKGFFWFAHFHFPFPAYIQVLQDMRRRPLSEHAERAWESISNNFNGRLIFLENESGPMLTVFSNIVINAWESRVAAFARQGESVMPPRIVSYVRHRQQALVSQTTTNNNDLMGVSWGGLPISTPTGSASSPTLYAAMGQYNLAGMSGMGFTGSPSQMTADSVDVDMTQFDWAALGWRLMNETPAEREFKAGQATLPAQNPSQLSGASQDLWKFE